MAACCFSVDPSMLPSFIPRKPSSAASSPRCRQAFSVRDKHLGELAVFSSTSPCPPLEQPILESPFRRGAETQAMAFAARSTVLTTLFPSLLFSAVNLEMNGSDQEMTEVNQSIPVNSSSFAKGPLIFSVLEPAVPGSI